MQARNDYRALVVREQPDGSFSKKIEQLPFSFLPQHEVLIEVKHAALNFKDALSASGHKGITRSFPHTPGVDAAGVVVEDASGTFAPGTPVICTSYDLGMNTFGAFAEYIRVPAAWVVPMPAQWSTYQAMVLGTAAYTAALALYKMERNGQNPSMGDVVVTGASGGVGTLAVSILTKAGYRVVASTGKKDSIPFLTELGAIKCISREDVANVSPKPIGSPKWAGAIDNVGGDTLVGLLKSCSKEGNIACVGLVGSPQLALTVYPFILNGVNLLGVDSAETPMSRRLEIWQLLAEKWMPNGWEKLGREVSLDEIPKAMDAMLNGQTSGRIVAKIGL
jgi:acrylyl-CoA reductase (NADPH)